MTTITPTTTPANWLVDIDEPLHGETLIGETTGVQIGLPVIVGEGYPLNWEVNHNGQLWRSQQANNFWEPGVFGWVVG